jgi:hypothetical protein
VFVRLGSLPPSVAQPQVDTTTDFRILIKAWPKMVFIKLASRSSTQPQVDKSSRFVLPLRELYLIVFYQGLFF